MFSINPLISINYKFMDLKPNELVDLIVQSTHTKGIEIFVDLYNDSERKYLRALVPVLVEHHLILQVH